MIAFQAQEHSQALIWIVDSFFMSQCRQIAELALTDQLPSTTGYVPYSDEGGLMAYGPSPATLWERLAKQLDRVFRGARPGDLPVEQPTNLDLVINRKTARALGMTIPPDLLVLAEKVIG